MREIVIPDSTFLLDDVEAQLVADELHASNHAQAAFAAGALAGKLEDDTTKPVELEGTELLALYRALENMRSAGELSARPRLERLHYVVASVAGVRAVDYELFLVGGEVGVKLIDSWTSYSGALVVGDRVVIPGLGAWRITDVAKREQGRVRLVCQPYDDENPPRRITPPGV